RLNRREPLGSIAMVSARLDVKGGVVEVAARSFRHTVARPLMSRSSATMLAAPVHSLRAGTRLARCERGGHQTVRSLGGLRTHDHPVALALETSSPRWGCYTARGVRA